MNGNFTKLLPGKFNHDNWSNLIYSYLHLLKNFTSLYYGMLTYKMWNTSYPLKQLLLFIHLHLNVIGFVILVILYRQWLVFLYCSYQCCTYVFLNANPKFIFYTNTFTKFLLLLSYFIYVYLLPSLFSFPKPRDCVCKILVVVDTLFLLSPQPYKSTYIQLVISLTNWILKRIQH